MNIHDYDIVPLEDDKQTYVEYAREDFDIETRYPLQSTVSIKGRRDMEGVIDRLEEGNVIVKMFGETYSVPPKSFDSIFFLYPQKKVNWYEKLR